MARIDGKLWEWSSESFQTKRKIHTGSRQKNHSLHGKVLCQEKIHIKKRSHLCWSPYQVKFQDNNFITFIAEVISFYDWNPGGILEEYRSHLQNSDQKVWKITIIICIQFGSFDFSGWSFVDSNIILKKNSDA